MEQGNNPIGVTFEKLISIIGQKEIELVVLRERLRVLEDLKKET